MNANELVVHVDAKIINRHSKTEPKLTLVGYVTQDGEKEYDKIDVEDAIQTDAAELYAIRFAIEKLKNRPEKIVLLCDHESVVSVLRKDIQNVKFRKKTRQIMRDVWNALQEYDHFEVRQFPLNQADKFLNEVWQKMKEKQSPRSATGSASKEL